MPYLLPVFRKTNLWPHYPLKSHVKVFFLVIFVVAFVDFACYEMNEYILEIGTLLIACPAKILTIIIIHGAQSVFFVGNFFLHIRVQFQCSLVTTGRLIMVAVAFTFDPCAEQRFRVVLLYTNKKIENSIMTTANYNIKVGRWS